MRFGKIALVLAGFVAGGAAGVQAYTIPLFNTGQGLADNSTDPNYSLVVNPDLTGTSAIVEDSTAFPLNGTWYGDTASAKWIGPRFNTASSAAGPYDYQTTFTLPSYTTLSTAAISGSWAFDDGSTFGGIYLNGHLVAPANSVGFGALTPFSISSSPFFLKGATPNTLDFVGNNSGSYTGVLVSGISGSYTPEPASLSLLGLGGLSLLARRRRA